MRSLVLLCLVLTLVSAQTMTPAERSTPRRPTTPDQCTGTHFKWVDQSAKYNAGAANTKGCIFKDFEEDCWGHNGLETCNMYHQRCVEIKGTRWTAGLSNDDTKLGSAITSQIDRAKGLTPSTCLERGEMMTWPDADVVIIAQVILSFCMFILALVATFIGSGFMLLPGIIFIFIFCMSVMLLFSYYYLNAIIVMACSSAAVSLYSSKNAKLTVGGMFLCLFALFWVTYQPGLGHIQHHSRLYAGAGSAETYEIMCENYYRSAFYFENWKMDNDFNRASTHWGYCIREWLSAELFFMIFTELLLILLAAAGARSLDAPQEEKKNENETEMRPTA